MHLEIGIADASFAALAVVEDDDRQVIHHARALGNCTPLFKKRGQASSR